MMAGTLASVSTLLTHRRAAVQALDGRERRPRARHRPPAFERLEQRRLLAADVGARAAKDVGSRTLTSVPRHAAPEQPGRFGLGDGRVQAIGRLDVLAADVDERRLGADRVAAQRDALEHACGSISIISRSLKVPGSDSSALTATYFAPGDFGDEAPLDAGRKARAAAAAQPGRLDLLDHLRPASSSSSALRQAVVAALGLGTPRALTARRLRPGMR